MIENVIEVQEAPSHTDEVSHVEGPPVVSDPTVARIVRSSASTLAQSVLNLATPGGGE